MRKLLFLVLTLCSLTSARAQNAAQTPQQPPRAIRVLTISGDWQSQAWYQDKWMGGGKLYRGRFIAQQVNLAAPRKFEFVFWTG